MQLSKFETRPPIVQAGLLFITLAPLYFASYSYRVWSTHSRASKGANESISSADFIHDWLETHVVAPYNHSPLANYCKRTEWHPNRIFRLDNANGGIGNVRGNILDFVFFAIEAGASIVLPDMAARSQDDLSNVWASRAPFDSFFDAEWFLQCLKEACPHMVVYPSEYNQSLAQVLPGNYLPRSRRMDVDAANTKTAYLEHFDAWVKEKENVGPDKPILVKLERTLWEVDTRSLPLGLRRNFGQILRVHPAFRRYAAQVVEQMKSKYHLPFDARDAIPAKAFFGAHLRTEADARNAGWLNDITSNFTGQTDAYLAQATKAKLRLIYVASGNSTDLEHFRRKALAHHPRITVTSKYDLLPSNNAAAFRELSWDQQALVDYEVLQRSSRFSGIVQSSFSYNIALTRNQLLEDRGRVMDPWFVMDREDGVAFDDGASRLLGRYEIHEKRVPRGMWP